MIWATFAVHQVGGITFEHNVLEDLLTAFYAPSSLQPENQESRPSEADDVHFRFGIAAVVI